MTTSRSHRPCLKIATRYAAGMPTKIASRAGTAKLAKSTLLAAPSSNPRRPMIGPSTTIPPMPAPATVATATSQRSC